MSTPASSPPSESLQSAQQQLDELDALIQRMLHLPANPAEELLPAGPAPSVDPVTQSDRPTLPDFIPPAPAVETPPETPPEGPALMPVEAREHSFSATGLETFDNPEDTPAKIDRQIEPPASQMEDEPEEEIFPAHSMGKRGLIVRSNQVFDRCTLPMGEFGHWLRAEQGRNLLGWTGIILLIGAAVWGFLDWFVENW